MKSGRPPLFFYEGVPCDVIAHNGRGNTSAMKSEFILAFNQICSERGLPAEVVLDALRTALVSAYRRNADIGSAQNVTVEIDQNSGRPEIYVEKEVVEKVHNTHTEVALKPAQKIDPDAQIGSTIMVESTPKNFGRIAAQTAKQVILQRIREAERDALYEDYIGREGEIINGMVQSVTPQHISINLGRTEAILPRKEQVPGERYTLHQRLRAYVVEVKRSGRGPQIIVSRSHRNMLRRLLELEVPEIYNGAVEIKAIAREAGARSKVAVAALQTGVDPVGSCVGMRGVRIQSIVNELGGEKIDVIEWSPDARTFIAKALSPARVLTVHLEESEHSGRTATVIVPDDQLSLAIGREGQNARLAAKLTGWRIDIKSITESAREAVSTILAELGNIAEVLPTVRALLDYRDETNKDYNTEQLLMLRKFVDGARNFFQTRHRQKIEDEKAAERAAITVEEAQQLAERDEALAQIPKEAYEISLEDLGLSTRVYNHLDKAEIENLGQIMERMVDGDEGLLMLQGVGPKTLAEIKACVEANMPGEAVAEPEAVAEEVQVEAEAEAEVEVEAEAEVEVEAEAEAEAEAEKAKAEEEAEVAEAKAEVEEAEAEVEAEAQIEQVEPEKEAQVEPEPVAVERDEAFAHIPDDAYDLPLVVLALEEETVQCLMGAEIENLGQVMEFLARGDETLLAIEGIDTKTLAKIKSQVNILISVPEEEPEQDVSEEPEQVITEARSGPRYEYVDDDELERKAKSKRSKSKRRRHVPKSDVDFYDDWDEFED